MIELMIIVVIIAILAAVALPAYQDYAVRARVSELAALTASMKSTVDENITNNGAGAGSYLGVNTFTTVATKNTTSAACTDATGIVVVTGTTAAKDVALNLIHQHYKMMALLLWRLLHQVLITNMYLLNIPLPLLNNL